MHPVSAFRQLTIRICDKKKSVFAFEIRLFQRKGTLYCFYNASGICQRTKSKVLDFLSHYGSFLKGHIDDVAIATTVAAEKFTWIRDVLTIFRAARLRLEKSRFLTLEVCIICYEDPRLYRDPQLAGSILHGNHFAVANVWRAFDVQEVSNGFAGQLLRKRQTTHCPQDIHEILEI